MLLTKIQACTLLPTISNTIWLVEAVEAYMNPNEDMDVYQNEMNTFQHIVFIRHLYAKHFNWSVHKNIYRVCESELGHWSLAQVHSFI